MKFKSNKCIKNLHYIWSFSKWFILHHKGGDSDDETESIGSGFTSIAPSTLKASTSMLPPSSIPIPKERLLRDLQVTTHDDHESKIQKVGKHTIFLFASGTFLIKPCIIILNHYFIYSFQPASAEPHKLVEDISQTRKVLPENIPKSNLQEEVSQVRCEIRSI